MADSMITKGSVIEEKPVPETIIRTVDNGGKQVRDFVNKNVESIQDSWGFTTIFIDTEREYNRYGIDIPAVMLICTDLRKTVASLKRDPLVIRFNKSKTLKRVSEWARVKVEGFKNQVWATMYVSASAYHLSKQKVNESCLTYFGYLEDDGTVMMAPVESFIVGNESYNIDESVGDHYVVEGVSFDETEINEAVDLDNTPLLGSQFGKYTVIGSFDSKLVFSDSDGICYTSCNK